jgi:hypothetical protein
VLGIEKRRRLARVGGGEGVVYRESKQTANPRKYHHNQVEAYFLIQKRLKQLSFDEKP